MPIYGPGVPGRLRDGLRNPAPGAGGGGLGGGVPGAIANNTLLPTSLITSGQMQQSTIHTVRRSSADTDFRIVFPRAYLKGFVTTPLPTSYVVQACAVRPLGGAWLTVTRAGATSWTVTPWDGTEVDTTIDLTDPQVPGFAPVNGADYELFIYATGANLPSVAAGNMSCMNVDEGLDTVVTTYTGPKTITAPTDTSRKSRFCILGIVGTTPDRTMFIFGDSQEAWTSGTGPTEGQFADHNRGMIASAVGSTYAYINASQGGESVEQSLFSTKLRRDLLVYCTDVIYAQGINSWNNKNNSNANVDVLTQRLMPLFNGKRVTFATTTPRTTGAWTLADATDQTAASYAASLITYNTTTLPGYGWAGPLDKFAVTRHPTATSKYNADGTTNRFTGDGLHPTKYVITTALDAATRAAWLATIAAAPVQSGKVQPVPAFTASSGTMAFSTILGSTWLSSTSTQKCDTVLPGTGKLFIEFKLYVSAAGTAFTLMTSSTSRYFKALTVTAAGTLTLTSNSAATVTSTEVVANGAEHTIRLWGDGTSVGMHIDGGAPYTVAGGNIGTLPPNFDFNTKASAPVVAVRELSVFRSATTPTTGYTVVPITGTEPDCVARFAFAGSAAGLAGPVLPA